MFSGASRAPLTRHYALLLRWLTLRRCLRAALCVVDSGLLPSVFYATDDAPREGRLQWTGPYLTRGGGLARETREIEHRGELDRVRRHARLPVVVVEERDAGNTRLRADPSSSPGVLHLLAPIGGKRISGWSAAAELATPLSSAPHTCGGAIRTARRMQTLGGLRNSRSFRGFPTRPPSG